MSEEEFLKKLRTEIREERISYGEIAELESLAEYIDEGDVELLQWAGVPEDGSLTAVGEKQSTTKNNSL